MMVYFALLLTGTASGFLAGLLGIGGGVVMVPVLLVLLPILGIEPALVPKVAVATSCAAMVPTACSAVLAQYRRGALDTLWVQRLAPGAAIGGALGSQLAVVCSGRWVAVVFAIYAGAVALKMLCGSAAEVHAEGRVGRAIAAVPSPLAGALIGAFSSIAGVGGAAFTVSFLLAVRVEMRRSVAVASAVGLAIALGGGAGFATASPVPWSAGSSALLGLVHWPAALMIAASATLIAPRGVSAGHTLPVVHLKKAFAALLVVVSAITLTKAANTIGLVEYATGGAAPDRAHASQRPPTASKSVYRLNLTKRAWFAKESACGHVQLLTAVSDAHTARNLWSTEI